MLVDMDTQTPATDRRERYRQRLKDEGYVQVSAWIPAHTRELHKRYVAALAKQFEKEKEASARSAQNSSPR